MVQDAHVLNWDNISRSNRAKHEHEKYSKFIEGFTYHILYKYFILNDLIYKMQKLSGIQFYATSQFKHKNRKPHLKTLSTVYPQNLFWFQNRSSSCVSLRRLAVHLKFVCSKRRECWKHAELSNITVITPSDGSASSNSSDNGSPPESPERIGQTKDSYVNSLDRDDACSWMHQQG